MLLQEFLENSARRLPGKTALVCELDARANRFAHALRASGVGYRDRVVIMLDNSWETVVSIFGTLKNDNVFVVVNPTIKKEKLGFILNNCRAAALVTHMGKWSALAAAVREVSSLRSVFLVGDAGQVSADGMLMRWDEALPRHLPAQPTRTAIDVDLAALIYTSGTTGDPKGVMLTHQNMVAASTSITAYLENSENDIILSTLPLSFDYGLYQVIMAAQFGGTVILEKSFLYPYAIINLLKQERVTGFPIVPTISAILLQLEAIRKERFDALRYITNTAAALPVSHIRGLQAAFPGVKIYSMYGLTECKRVSYLPPGELDRRPTSVGRGMPNEQVYLVDEAGNVIMEPGVVGELVVRGANVMKGYWENPEETAEMLRPGPYPWEQVLYTGDLFKMDGDGFLYFVSRKDNIIKSRGEKVSPREVESVLYELAGIVEAAVVGVPDELLGEAIKAFVVLKEGSRLTDQEIKAHCAKHLEDFMVPKIVEFKKSLPKTPSGKITVKGL
jgi:long-chain acyl-CoA synthetase